LGFGNGPTVFRISAPFETQGKLIEGKNGKKVSENKFMDSASLANDVQGQASAGGCEGTL
jgi:hypothetical protein